MTSREMMLRDIRRGLGREEGGAPAAVPEVRLRPCQANADALVDEMLRRVEAVGGLAVRVKDAAAAREYVASVTQGREAVASNSTYLAELGIPNLPGVLSGFTTEPDLRTACAHAGFGISSADYALADTGTLVMLSGAEEARFVSLLPPVH
ncbi:MAG TPA: LUD domain-containing protein, partial [Bryobacteraceae bacterium]|nr:LUD domain-containing protein [Bryobacteraceae bacterium]